MSKTSILPEVLQDQAIELSAPQGKNPVGMFFKDTVKCHVHLLCGIKKLKFSECE